MTEPIIVNTLETLGLIHRAYRQGTAPAQAAADSVLSGLIVQIKYPQASLPGALREHLDLLTS